MSQPLLQVRDLRVGFQADDALLTAVDGISFDIAAGQTLGIVGESGCGKTVTAMSLMRLLPQPAGRILSGSISFQGRDLVNLPLEAMRKVRGKEIAMIFQEPMTALNPVHRVGRQIIENLQLHQALTPTAALRRAVELMEWVGIPAPDQRVNEFPHQLSGGMRQRVMIAMALSCNPKLLIADEPTTALDVTVQAQILDLIKRLQHDTGMAVILITHDLGVVAETCDEVAVMYAGRIAERGPVRAIFDQPRHPYTQGLIRCLPKLEHPPKTPLPIIEGMVPSLRAMPSGCRFAPRCPNKPSPSLLNERQPWKECGDGHGVEACACFANAIPDNATADNATADKTTPITGNKDAAPSVSPQEALAAVPPLLSGSARADQPPPRHEESAVEGEQRLAKPLLTVQNLKLHFPVKGGVFHRTKAVCKAVDGISFALNPGETLGLVGESGCGKSTVARSVVRLLQPTAGQVIFNSHDISHTPQSALRLIRRDMQMVFQDPAESLNPRHTVGQILEEPYIIQGIGSRSERGERVAELLGRVGLPADAADRYSFEFSGGQRQRIGIARALALKPKLIVCDEPVSALDVSVQAQVLNLLLELQRDFGLAYLFIAHDLGVVKHMSDRVAVMYLGKIVELASAEQLYRDPRHAYTKALLSAIPEVDPALRKQRILLEGDVPSPINPPAGCAFGHRVTHPKWKDSVGMDLTLKEVAPGHWVQPCPCCVT